MSREFTARREGDRAGAPGLADDAVGDKVTLAPAGMAPIEGVVNYATGR
jgi:hypothetical protein